MSPGTEVIEAILAYVKSNRTGQVTLAHLILAFKAVRATLDYCYDPSTKAYPTGVQFLMEDINL